MDKLEKEHIDFLRICADSPWRRHESSIAVTDLQQMVNEGLLIMYNTGVTHSYAITKVGSQVLKSYGDSPELVKIAIRFVMSQGYSEEDATAIVQQHGAEVVLQSQREQAKQDSQGQREIKIPLDEQGKPNIKIRG